MRRATPDILGDVLSAPKPPTMLAVEAIKVDGGTQMRAGLHEETVAEYAQAFGETREWGEFPPVVVFYDGADYWLADGFHRVAAWRKAGNALLGMRLPAEVRSGTRRDAILYAAGANANHGLRRTNADKRRAVEVMLRDEEWAQWSDGEIARRCQVSQPFVSALRRSLTQNDFESKTERRGADGRVIDTANIGKSRPTPGERYLAGLPALNMTTPTATPAAAAAPVVVDAWAAESGADDTLTAADVQVLQPTPTAEPEMVPLAAVSRLGQVIGTALGAAATSPTVEAGIARARELLATPAPPADDRRTRLSQYIAQFEATLASLADWAQLTGRFTCTAEAERGLRKVIEATRSELAALNGQPHQAWGEEAA